MQVENQCVKQPSILPDSTLKAVANDVRGLCAVVTKIARRDQQQLLDRHQAGISAIEHGVMRRLSNGTETLADLSRLMAVTPSTLVYVIDALARRRLVIRTKDKRDRRRELLSLTGNGRKLLASIPDMDAESALVQSLERMIPRERAGLHKLLRKFAANLQGAADWRPELQGVRPAGIEIKSGKTRRCQRRSRAW
jgi:DNA-binding MarR family transcriptional regulator